MDQAALTAYDQTRNFSNKAVRSLCYAPYTSLFFSTTGQVRVCCHNWAHPVGNILENSIDEIWQGVRVKILREALKNYKFGPGCEFCRGQTEKTFANAAMRRYDKFAVADEAPLWPQLIELSISNTCNLE
jgi:MoaA/NifB/PqqE/SkfB family radical SAM enzyme